MPPQQKVREFVLQDLYSLSMGGEASLAVERAMEIFSLVDRLDEKIATASEAYALERIDLLDRNILRMSLFEFLENQVEPDVLVGEALRLSRKFSTKEAGRFIHAMLAALFALPARKE